MHAVSLEGQGLAKKHAGDQFCHCQKCCAEWLKCHHGHHGHTLVSSTRGTWKSKTTGAPVHWLHTLVPFPKSQYLQDCTCFLTNSVPLKRNTVRVPDGVLHAEMHSRKRKKHTNIHYPLTYLPRKEADQR